MKKIRNILMAFVAIVSTISISSCSEHVEDIEQFNVSVGNILLSNNKIIQQSSYDQSMSAIGVVMHVSSDSVWIVSAKELDKAAYLDTLMTVSNVSSDETKLCGRENTAALMLSGRQAPAAIEAYNFSSPVRGWFLPSLGELRLLSVNLPTIEKSMELIGGDAFDTGQYLSSTQDGSSNDTEQINAKCITLQTGLVSSMFKFDKGAVRPVLVMRMQ